MGKTIDWTLEAGFLNIAKNGENFDLLDEEKYMLKYISNIRNE